MRQLQEQGPQAPSALPAAVLFFSSTPVASWRILMSLGLSLVYRWFGGLGSQGGRHNGSVF